MQETTKHTVDQVTVQRAALEVIDSTWKIMQEYYEAAAVVARDEKDDFARTYFGDGAGVWLATLRGNVIGCVALRRLSAFSNCGEVKRLYVQPEYRGRGIAVVLYRPLESYARTHGYQALYLDTAADMIAAQKFYASLGYEHLPRYNDNPQAAMFMRKNLRPFAN